MKFFRSRAGAALVLAVAVVFSTVFGSYRSLNAVRSDVLTIFEGDSDGFGHSVKGDLVTRAQVAANLYAVADRYLATDDFARNRLFNALEGLKRDNIVDPIRQADLLWTTDLVFEALEKADLSEQDAKYVSSFQAQMASAADTIARDPYTAAAKEFNETTLGTFPASLLGPLTGVHELPIYH